MRNELGELFLGARTKLGWTLQGLAWRAGYRRANQAARRLGHLERGFVGTQDLLKRAGAALGLNPQAVAEAKARDQEAREAVFAAWLEVPQPMVLIEYVVGITFCLPIPPGLGEKQAIDYALALQKQRGQRMCLVLDRRHSLWIEGDEIHFTKTTIDRPTLPFSGNG